MLARKRLKPVALCGDLKQTFLQVRFREEGRDSLRFHWLKNKDPTQIVVPCYTRALFGLVQSPFILRATANEHVSSCECKHPAEVEQIRRGLYVDDVISGASTVEEVRQLKKTTILIFKEATFELHEWHSTLRPLIVGGGAY